jgi:site-specific DNA-cytosine methylase
MSFWGSPPTTRKKNERLCSTTNAHGATSVKFLSVCSGIETASVAWNPLGWEAAAFSEIEKFPSSVLAHHYPHVPNWGDMTRYQDWDDAGIDVLVGGMESI